MIFRIATLFLAAAFTFTLAACASPEQSADEKMPSVAGRSYAVPNALLFYQYSGGTTRPIANSPLGIVDDCAAGQSADRRRTGFDCP
jgi:hypothetical protein